jgi:hypothetical protein
LVETGGTENGQVSECVLAVGKRARESKSVMTVYQGSCARCEQSVRTDENHLKAHLWASTAVFHWECFIVLMKEHRGAPAQDATRKVSRDTRG